ncbi:hypothetical protein [Streptomyces sp. SA3_actF]|uniref:hypothetical protein n=1 Tax=Streptomyces sp. SA3_actF TaxID=682181 RepID=UPI001F317215|nr:hypothetical protein [Streptomyces sp. SA3_actF]
MAARAAVDRAVGRGGAARARARHRSRGAAARGAPARLRLRRAAPPWGQAAPARTAVAVLLLSAGLLAVWEAVRVDDYGSVAYRGALLGNRSTTLTLLATPQPWWAAALVLLALAAGIACAARARAGARSAPPPGRCSSPGASSGSPWPCARSASTGR